MSVVTDGKGFAAWSAQRVEVYTLVPSPDGGPLLLPGGAEAGRRRVPGVVLAHGENPRDAALRALRRYAEVPAVSREALRVREVLSEVRPLPGHPGLHVLRLAFEVSSHPALGTGSLTVDPGLLHDPVPAWASAPPPGAPPRVQRPGAYAIVVRDGEVLLTRVAGPGVWSLPGGGIDHGEHPDDAVRRETFEESGLRLSSAHLLDVDSRHFTGRSPTRVTEDYHGVRILYRGTIDDRREPEVQEIGGSTDAAAWWRLDRLHEVPVTEFARATLDRHHVRS